MVRTFVIAVLAALALLAWASRGVLGVATQEQLVITTSPLYLPEAPLESPYSIQLEAGGGKPPYTWKALDQLPSGIVLDKGGVLSGTPKTTGQRRFQVEVRDSSGHVGVKVIQFEIRRVIAIQ